MPRSPTRRVVVIVAVWLAGLLAAAVAYVALEGDAAEARGRERYSYRDRLEEQLREVARTHPRVIWMGDSTILAFRSISYPQLVRGAVPGVRSAVVGVAGADFFTYYPLVAELLATSRPDVLVVVAHLRLFASPASPRETVTRNDLASMIPPADLPSAVGLPFAIRGLTLPRLVLAQLLRDDRFERLLYVVDGARARVSEADVPWLGPNRSAPENNALRALFIALRGSDVPIGPDHPMVRMMAATVRLARRDGVRVVVVGTPIPFERMTGIVGYDPDLYRVRFALLGDAVEQAGGVFVDLHEALPAAMFEDAVGHFTPDGAALLAERLRPIVAREVEAASRESGRRVSNAGRPRDDAAP